MNVSEPRTGLRTTEFWITLLTALLPALTIVFHRDFTTQVQTWATVAAGIATAVYVVTRGFVKTRYARESPAVAEGRPPVRGAVNGKVPTPVSRQVGRGEVTLEDVMNAIEKLNRRLEDA